MAYNSQPEEQFLLDEVFTSGFQDKLQPDEVPPGSAIMPSTNFTIDDDGKWVTRMGTQYLGTQANLELLSGTCTSAGRLRRRDGVEIPVVAFGTYTKYLHPLGDWDPVSATGNPDWILLETGLTDQAVWGFGSYDRSSDNLNQLVMCNARDNYRIWTGAIDLFSGLTPTTVTTASSTGLASELFTASGSIIISRGDRQKVFTYTGVFASTFTGVSPNPQAGYAPGIPFDAGDMVAQLPVQYPSAPKGNVIMCTNNARVLVANVLNSTTNEPGGGQIYGSKIDSPSDFTFSSPRDPGDGFIVSYAQGGGTVTGISQKENVNYIFKSDTIQLLSFSTDGEDFVIQQPLTSYDERTSADEGSVGALAVFRAENTIVFVTPTNTINTVNRVQNIDYVQTLPISDAIKNFVDNCIFDTQTAGVGYRGRLYIACKSSDMVAVNDTILVYNLRYRCWETPISGLPIAAWFVYATNLYGCLASSPDVVQIGVGTTDFKTQEEVGTPIDCELTLGLHNFGSKDRRKEFDQYYIEGEMDESGNATFTFDYDEGAEVRQGNLLGTENGFFFSNQSSGEFGIDPFGIETFGPEVIPGTDVTKRRFRLILTTKIRPFYTLSMSISTASYFKLLAHGPNARQTQFQKPKTVYKAMTLTPPPPPPPPTNDLLLLETGDLLLQENGNGILLEDST